MHCIYGEYDASAPYTTGISGSPPHTRGISDRLQASSFCCRFTPAYAGNIPLPKNTRIDNQGHPRIRGEYKVGDVFAFSMLGSPPHTRGISKLYTAGNGRYRFTPAYAGNIKALTECSCKYQVHPRIRGEYFGTAGFFLCSLRFTPAYAGNILILHFPPIQIQVHPRIRGEYSTLILWIDRVCGSPPHTRGISRTRKFDRDNDRFTPAYAGNIFCRIFI